jgi:hypothetical protein
LCHDGNSIVRTYRMLKKARLLTHPTLARRDAPFPKQGGWREAFRFPIPLLRGVAEAVLHCAH